MNLENYYYHAITKDNIKDTYKIIEQILKDKQLKSQKILGKNNTKYNGLDYISLASYSKNNNYKSFIIDIDSFNKSKLSIKFTNYTSYLDYMRLNNELEKPLSKEEYFKKNNTDNKEEYYKYLESISRTYPVDISYLYKKTKDPIYKDILDMIDDDILYCYKSDNCFDAYIKNTKGITFIFPKTIKVEKVNIIPNLPLDIESKLVNKISHLDNRYSNQLGEVQVKNYLDIDESIGIIISDELDINKIDKILKENNYNIKIYKIIDNNLYEIKIGNKSNNVMLLNDKNIGISEIEYDENGNIIINDKLGKYKLSVCIYFNKEDINNIKIKETKNILFNEYVLSENNEPALIWPSLSQVEKITKDIYCFNFEFTNLKDKTTYMNKRGNFDIKLESLYCKININYNDKYNGKIIHKF